LYKFGTGRVLFRGIFLGWLQVDSMSRFFLNRKKVLFWPLNTSAARYYIKCKVHITSASTLLIACKYRKCVQVGLIEPSIYASMHVGFVVSVGLFCVFDCIILTEIDFQLNSIVYIKISCKSILCLDFF